MKLTLTIVLVCFFKIAYNQARHTNDVPKYLLAFQVGAEKGFKWNEYNNPKDYPYFYREHTATWGPDFNLKAAYGLNVGVLKYLGLEFGYTSVKQTVVHHYFETFYDSLTNNYHGKLYHVPYDFLVSRFSAGLFGQMEAPFTDCFGLSIAQGFQFIISNTIDVSDKSRSYKEFLMQPRMNFELYFSHNHLRLSTGCQFRVDFRGNIYENNPDYPKGKWGKLIWVYWSPYISLGYRFGKTRIPKYRADRPSD